MTGHLYVFINRRGDVAQILFWDRTGFVVMRKRLEAGTFRLIRQADVSQAPGDRRRGVEPDVGRDRPGEGNPAQALSARATAEEVTVRNSTVDWQL